LGRGPVNGCQVETVPATGATKVAKVSRGTIDAAILARAPVGKGVKERLGRLEGGKVHGAATFWNSNVASK
jgi:hypothetical protein